MDDTEILNALSMLTQAIKGRMGGGGAGTADDLSGFAPDPENKVKGWSGINLVRGEDDRPTLADKDYVIQKMALGNQDEMPHDGGGMGNYARPF